MARESSCHGVIVMGVGKAPTPSLLGEGRPHHPPPLQAMWNSLVESSIMAHCGDGGPLRVEPMKVVPEFLLLGERLRLPKLSMMNSKLPRQMISLWKKPQHVKRSLSTEMVSRDERTIGTS
jgi:hypothetical protein